jgi:hypothetical protein
MSIERSEMRIAPHLSTDGTPQFAYGHINLQGWVLTQLKDYNFTTLKKDIDD